MKTALILLFTLIGLRCTAAEQWLDENAVDRIAREIRKLTFPTTQHVALAVLGPPEIQQEFPRFVTSKGGPDSVTRSEYSEYMSVTFTDPDSPKGYYVLLVYFRPDKVEGGYLAGDVVAKIEIEYLMFKGVFEGERSYRRFTLKIAP